MNPPSLPSLYALYWHDRAVRFYINGMIFMVLLGVGIPWATTPVPGSPPLDPSSPEKLAAEWAPLVTPVIGVLMLGLLLLRRSFIRRTLSEGKQVTGKVEKVDTYSRQINSDSNVTERPRYEHSYWATISYEVNGSPYKVRLKLPYSPSTDGVHEGLTVDLMVLESSPKRPLIKSTFQLKTPKLLFF